MPPSLLLVGSADPLLDDSIMMAAELTRQGAEYELHVVPDAPHAFNRLPLGLAEFANEHARRWMSALI